MHKYKVEYRPSSMIQDLRYPFKTQLDALSESEAKEYFKEYYPSATIQTITKIK